MEYYSNDGEPKSKRLSLSRKSELDSEVSSNRDPSEVCESSTSQEEYFIGQQFPVEMLQMIFTHLPQDLSDGSAYKKGMKKIDLRLVCRAWCDVLSRNVKISFRGTVPHTHLENCGFESITLRLHDVDLSELPPSTWEKIGCKLNSLVLDRCKIGDQCLKNIIIHCCNLQSLKVVLKSNENNADLLCSRDANWYSRVENSTATFSDTMIDGPFYHCGRYIINRRLLTDNN